MRNYLLNSLVIVLVACSGDNGQQEIQQTIAGTWFSDCVESTALPFPPGPAAFLLNGYVTVELNFDNGNVIADGVFHTDDTCSSTDMPTRFFEGTYTVGDTATAITGDEVNTIHFTGDDALFAISWDYESYFVIENGALYLNDALSSDINIRRDIAYSR